MSEPVARLTDLPEGQPKRALVQGHTLLLVRRGQQVHALEATCPHAKASLAFGVVVGERVVCPLHLAHLDLATGCACEPPALDGVPRWQVRVEGDDVFVQPAPAPEAAPFTPDPADTRTFLVVGAGAAGAAAVQTLRAEGYRGRLVWVGDEPEGAYERPDLSKTYLMGVKDEAALALLPPERWAAWGVETRFGVRVDRLDAAAREAHLSDGTRLAYDQALVATGGTPRRLPLPGADAPNVLNLRTLADGRRLKGLLEGARRVALIGAGFIGLELAATLRKKKLEVTVVAPEEVPFERILGRPVGQLIADLHRAQGVDLRLGRGVKALEQADGRVVALTLDDGSRVEADVVLLGIGVTPATGFVQGVPTGERDGALLADATLAVAPGLWAAGDIVRFPLGPEGAPTRIEHFRVAQQQGRTAARGMLGRPKPHTALPFFWTHQYTLMIQMVGHAGGFDDIVYQGEPGPKGFLAFYLRAGRVIAALGAQKGREMAVLEHLLAADALPPLDAIRAGVDWLALAR